MKSKAVLILAGVLCAACESDRGESADGTSADDSGVAIVGQNSNFLVKLTSSMSAGSSEPGDPVTGVAIDPVPLRGARLEGTIDRADRSFLDFSFHTVHFEGKTYPIESQVTAVVSSKGNAGHDDLGQRIRMVGGGVIAYGTTTAIDEGAEIRFVAWEGD